MNFCVSCGEDFLTVNAFDEHRVGFHAFSLAEGLKFDPPREDGRRCLTVSELSELGWAKNEQQRWQYPRDWDSRSWMWELDPNEVEITA